MGNRLEFIEVAKSPDISGLSFSLEQGEVAGAAESIGAVRLASGLVRLDGGDILLGQASLSRDFERAMARTGVVAGAGVYPQLTGREHLQLAARMYGQIPAGRIDEVASALSLGEFLPRRAKCFDEDVRWRLALAQALLHDPDLLLLELPDAQISLFKQLLPAWREAGKTILLSGSERIEPLCDRMVVRAEPPKSPLQQETASPREVHCFFDVDQPIDALYALEKDFPDVSFEGNLLELAINQEQAEQVSQRLYERGIEVLQVTWKEV